MDGTVKTGLPDTLCFLYLKIKISGICCYLLKYFEEVSPLKFSGLTTNYRND